MAIDKRQYEVKAVLDSLRAAYGDGEFGYRMQALFAHVLLRIGALVTEVNAKGHPDVKADLGDRILKVQVKTTLHGNRGRNSLFSQDDLQGIKSEGKIVGYLAVLDCAEPVSWILIPENRLHTLVGSAFHIATFRAERTQILSDECTDEFLELVLAHKERLATLTFHILASRAIKGEPL